MKAWVVMVVAAVAASVLGAMAGPAHAAVEIRRINFNPAGRDTGDNSHLNREYVYLVNSGPRSVQLRGWKIFDRGREHVYRFGSLYLAPGDTIHLRTGSGDDGAAVCEGGCPAFYSFYWDLAEYVWDNDGDRAILIDDSGNVRDRCRYGSSASSPRRC